MLSFFSPLYVTAGIAAAGFVVFIHYYSRRAARREFAFSNLRLLREILYAKLPKKRLADALLAFLRAAAVLMIFLFLAKPLLRGVAGRDESRRGRGKDVFWFVVDVSYSMGFKDAGGITALERVRQAAGLTAEVLKRTYRNCRIGLLSFSDAVEGNLILAPTHDIVLLRQSLDRLAVLPKQTGQAAWVEWLAAGKRDGPHEIGGVFVFTDMAKHGFNDEQKNSPPSQLNRDGPPIIFIAAGSGSGKNRRLAAVYDENKGEAEIRIDCFGDDRGKSPVALRIEEAEKGSVLAAMRVNDCQASTVPLERFLPGAPAKERALLLKLEQDRLPIDDTRPLAIARPVRGGVLIIDGEPGRRADEGESFYVREALKSMRYAGRWSWIVEEEANRIFNEPSRSAGASGPNSVPEALRSGAAAAQQIWLLNAHKPAPAFVSFLRNFIQDRRHKLIVSLGPGSDLKNLGELLTVLFGQAQEAGEGRLAIKGLRQKDEKWLGNFSATIFNETDWRKIKVNKYFPAVNLPDSSETLLAFEVPGKEEIPLLIKLNSYQAQIFLLTTTIDAGWTNLPFKGAFPVIIRGLLEAVVSEPLAREAQVGGYWTAPAQTLGYSSVSLISPSGRKLSPTYPSHSPLGRGQLGPTTPRESVGGEGDSGFICLGPLEEPGFYKFSWGGLPVSGLREELPQILAAYLPDNAPESDLTRAVGRDLKVLLGAGAKWTIIPMSEVFKNPKKASMFLAAKEISRPVLLGVFLLLAAESLVVLLKPGNKGTRH